MPTSEVASHMSALYLIQYLIKTPQTDGLRVVVVDQIGDLNGLLKGNSLHEEPKELLIAEYASKVITGSPYYKEGFSFQTEAGVSFSAATRFIREAMIKDGIKASFCTW